MAEIIVPDLFTETKKAIAAYKAEAEELQRQEDQLKAELEDLQNQMVENTLAKETAEVSEKIYLLTENNGISKRSRVTESVLDELQEEKHALKIKYMEIYQKATGEASAVKQQFNISNLVDRHLSAMFTEITSISNQMKQQYMEIYDDMAEVFADERINQEYRNARYKFTRDSYKLSYFENRSNILKKDHISYSLEGYFHPDFNSLKPKEAVSND